MIPSWSITKEDGVAQIDVSSENESTAKQRSSFNSQLGSSESNRKEANSESKRKQPKKQSFRQFLRSLRECESNSNGPWLASSEDLIDVADEEGFVIAQARCKKKKKSNEVVVKNEEDLSEKLKSLSVESEEVGGSGTRNSCDEIMEQRCAFEFVKSKIPEIDEAEFCRLVKKIEDEGCRTFNHFSKAEILSKIVDLRESSRIRNTAEVKRKSAWADIPQTNSTRVIESVDCPICWSPLQKNEIILEKCGHCFHSVCIRFWMKQRNTCPVCCGYSLLPDEFPRLGETSPA